jgi:DNA-binding winged helix-turn-helix (wHTH) protein
MGPRRHIIRFAQFTFDADTRQLIESGKVIHLSPKAFELLLILIENRPKAVSKADLQAKLWPDAFVTEANLPGLAKEIRRALRDDPRHPRFLRTLHGFGYAFAGEADDDSGRTGGRDDITFWIVADGQFRLAEGANILGRDPEANVWVNRPGVSRRHARVVVAGDAALLEDLGSTNGTWLRGERVTMPTPLHDGDEIRLGPVAVVFRLRRTAASTEVFQ